MRSKAVSIVLLAGILSILVGVRVSAATEPSSTWTIEEGVRLEGGWPHSPDIVELADGTYRMYYADAWDPPGYPIIIRSAISSDGLTWTKEPNVRIGYSGEGGWAGTPETIILPDGTYRMYYSNERYPFVGPLWGHILSAVSTDGLTWTKESGIRVDYGGTYDALLALSPNIVERSDGTYRMYYAGYDGEHYRILSAVSVDRLTWTKEPAVRIDIGGTYDSQSACHPKVIQVPDGRYIMLYDGGDPEGIGRILSAVSTDGLTWTKESGIRIDGEGLPEGPYKGVAPGEIIQLSDNQYRVYFSANTGGWEKDRFRIFSAIAVIICGPIGSPPSDYYSVGNQEQRSGSSTDPVNTATGNFFHEEVDLSIASRGIPLTFSRYYNSMDKREGPLGPAWTHSYNIVLTQDPCSGLVSVRWGDGRTDYWNSNGQGGYEPNTPGLYDILVENIDGAWTVKTKNLDVYRFDETGKLKTIADKNSNTFLLGYNHPTDPNLLTTITDPAGRSLALAYDSNGLLTSLTDFASPPRVVQYSYTNGQLTQVTDVLGNTINYGYDPNGYLETVIDQRGVTTVTNVYDANGRVIEQWDGNGNTTLFACDTPGPNQTTITDPNGNSIIHTHYTGYKLLASIQNPLGDIISYTHDENMNHTSITDRNGHTTTFTYDSRGNVTSKRDPDDLAHLNYGGVTIVEYNDPNFPDLPTEKIDALGNVWTYEYDEHGNLLGQVDPNGNQRIWTYNSFGQKLTEQDERGPEYVTQYIYDTDGLLIETIDPNGNHTWYGYDDLWRMTSVTNGRASSPGDPNHTTIIAYDNADHIISVTDPITSESYQYDNIGNRTHVTNGRGHTILYQYDNNNNLTKVERIIPSGPNQVTRYTYDELNRKISETDPNGNVTTYEYDAAGRLTRETNAEGNEITHTYDAQGNALSITDGNDVTTMYEYDALNRKVHQYDELGNHWYWQYNKLGQLTKHTDAMGSETRYEYDELGRLISIINDANNSTEYEYDAVGNLILIEDANNKIIEQRFYDTANRLIRQEDGLGNAYEYSYDGAGNMISEKNPNGQTKIFAYDNENRLIEIHYPDSNQVTYSYDNNGNLVSMTDPTGTTTYTYDELDRLTSSTDSFGKQVQYFYDIIGNHTSITYPADSTNPARTVTYTYDKANRLDKIIDWAGRMWDYTVDGTGRITDVNYPSGVKELRSYDDAGRLSSLLYKDSNDAKLISYSYIRDAQGNPIKIGDTGTLAPDISALIKNVSYTHDSDNRLISTTAPATYGYDNNGNLTSRTTDGVTITFTYDFENRLTSQSTGANTVQHIYDGQDNRIARIENGQETRYVLDRKRNMRHILCEMDASGEITAYYIHGPQILARMSADGSQRYYHTNHVGSVVALTDETGAITDRYVYTPFGVPTSREGTTPNPLTYVGGFGVTTEADSLYYMRARFYDPGTGRFLSKDPLTGSSLEPVTFNQYLYADNCPTNLVDPTGEIPGLAFGFGKFISPLKQIGKWLVDMLKRLPTVDPEANVDPSGVNENIKTM